MDNEDDNSEIVKREEFLEEPVPVSEWEQLEAETRIVDTVYRRVVQQEAAEQVTGVAGIFSELVDDETDNESGSLHKNDTGSPIFVGAQKPTFPLSTGESEGSGSIGLQLRFSGGGSTEGGELIPRSETVEDLIALSPSLDTALKLNMTLQRRYREKLMELEMVLKNNLARQAQLKEEIAESKRSREQEYRWWDGSGKPPLRMSYFCVPYFKNRHGMPAPKNEDGKFKVDNGYLDLYTTRSRPWMIPERAALTEAAHEAYKEEEIKVASSKLLELKLQLKRLDSSKDSKSKADLQRRIREKEMAIKKIEATSALKMLPKLDAKLDWDRVAALGFDGHRSPEECQLMWTNLVHPGINTSEWSEEEDITIQRTMMNLKNQSADWEQIAKQLKTNRTAYLVMQRWVSFIHPTLHPAKWTPEASQKLLDTVNMLRSSSHIPWSQVHQHMVGFSRAQIQSRWRHINPEMSKGPFTVEEDFILIKGLYMFGLNFGNIVHFMPGRDVNQVRERYKRTILPGLSYKPWTKTEDDILIKECKVGSKNWRKMLTVIPKRDACQIRCRYHIIQVYQTLTKSNKVPPPLFPVTITTDPETIHHIRESMINDDIRIKEIVDSSRRKLDLISTVKELEMRRLEIKERKAEKSVEKLKHATERRGRRPGVSVPHYTPLHDVLLTDFFLPWRSYPADFRLGFDNVQTSLRLLSKAFQLKILKEVSPSEQKMFGVLDMTHHDLDLIKSLITTHTHAEEDQPASECPACEPSTPESIPLVPPSQVTVGALRSLLYHRQKLEEMTSGEFFLFQLSKSELISLGSSHHRGKLVRRISAEASVEKKAKPSGKKRKRGVSDETSQPEAECSPKALKVKILEVSKPGPSQDMRNNFGFTSDEEEEETEGNRGSNVEFTPQKIHVTSNVAEKPASMKYCVAVRGEMEQQGFSTYSKGKKKSDPGATKESAKGPVSTQGYILQSMEEPVLPSRSLDKKKDDAEEISDNLLFQRMLSIFYWPALMTTVSPSEDLMSRVRDGYALQKKAKGTKTVSDSNKQQTKKPWLTKDDLDIEEQQDYIEKLAEREKQYQKWLNERKGIPYIPVSKLKDSQDVTKPKRGRGRPRGSLNKRGRGRGRGGVAVQTVENPKSVNEMVVEMNETTNKDAQKVDGDKNADSGVAKPPGRLLNKYHCKRNLTSLRRSLVMKKIWEGRRKGSLPQRTSDRDKRHYQARASRTRDAVRREFLKPPKMPNPWDLPLSGPMKVQPMLDNPDSPEAENVQSTEVSIEVETT